MANPMPGAEVQALATTTADDAVGVLAFVESLTIETDEQRTRLVEIAAEIKQAHKAAKTESTKATKPLREALEVVRGWFRPAQKSLEAAEGVLKQKILTYDRVKREENDRKLREAAERAQEAMALEAAAASQDDAITRTQALVAASEARGEAGALIAEANANTAQRTAGDSTRRTVKPEVDDLAAAIEWCIVHNMASLLTLNAAALKALAKSGNPPKIPGVRWVEVETLAITPSKL